MAFWRWQRSCRPSLCYGQTLYHCPTKVLSRSPGALRRSSMCERSRHQSLQAVLSPASGGQKNPDIKQIIWFSVYQCKTKVRNVDLLMGLCWAWSLASHLKIIDFFIPGYSYECLDPLFVRVISPTRRGLSWEIYLWQRTFRACLKAVLMRLYVLACGSDCDAPWGDFPCRVPIL